MVHQLRCVAFEKPSARSDTRPVNWRPVDQATMTKSLAAVASVGPSFQKCADWVLILEEWFQSPLAIERPIQGNRFHA
ncbi:hypothetical protein T12_16280 [Trichinella patagoniensis]|uniref:Uncharacterized protein n=1 Tax=Trichinella patagoniensis TaxID=990121 RepID=A0A0V1A200_9BILA|nr:hypothetical protein T12_16280 [Trichinella patagoniensis]